MDGEWLISSSYDKRTLIWDFNNIFMSNPPLSVNNNNNNNNIDNININSPINIICDILHYQPVTYSSISPNKQYLITITQYQPTFDDFKHNKNLKNYIRRENDRYSYPTKYIF